MGAPGAGDRARAEAIMKKHPLSELEADIRDHIERDTEDNSGPGMTPGEARGATRRVPRRTGETKASRARAEGFVGHQWPRGAPCCSQLTASSYDVNARRGIRWSSANA